MTASLTDAQRYSLAFAALRDPATHGLPPGADVTVIETHGAAVFLAGPKAWKIKKPFDFGYMDFSTLEKRHWALGREAIINRAWARELYRDIVPLCRFSDGPVRLGGEGEIVEIALEMVRFDPDNVLATLAENGRFSASLAEGAARAAARGAASAPVVDTRCPIDAVAMIIASNADCLTRHAGWVDPARITTLTEASTKALHRLEPLLRARAAAGLMRQCHADLHLGNIVLINGVPTPFDGIEFSQAFTEIDVAYDAAFLLMDIWRRGLRAEAARAFAGWVDEAARTDGDAVFDGLAVLPLFLSIRAGVRAHCAADAQDFALALTFLDEAEAMLAGSAPRLIALGGLSGSGKSTLARALAPHLASAPGALVLRSDEVRKRLAVVGPLDPLARGEYTPEASARVYDALAREAATALRAGRSVIVDAVFGDPNDQATFAGIASRIGVPFHGLWLDANTQTRIGRVEARINDASDADATVAAHQTAPLDGMWERVDASGSFECVFAAAKAKLERLLEHR